MYTLPRCSSKLRHALGARLRTQRWTQTDASGGGAKGFNKKEYDAQKYGGMKSVDTLFSEPQKKSLVGRWDWHLWQFMLALIPPGMVVLLAQWARKDMAAHQLEKESQAMAEMAEMMEKVQRLRGQAGQEGGRPGGEGAAQRKESSDEVTRRLAELEAMVQALAAKQQAAQGATAATAQPSAATAPSEAAAGASTSGAKPGDPPALPKLPDNPLDRWLPETDCQFCNDTRQKLWGQFKAVTGYKSKWDKEQAAKAAATAAAGPATDRSAAPVHHAPGDASVPSPAGSSSEQQQPKPEAQAQLQLQARGTSAQQEPAEEQQPEQISPAVHSEQEAAGSVAAAALVEVGFAAGSSREEAASAPPAAAGAKVDDAAATSPAASAAEGAAASSVPLAIVGSSTGSSTGSSSSRPTSGQPPPLPKLPDNPLDRWLPETDCQFCNDTRQKLWGAFKESTGFKSALDKAQAQQQAAARGGEGKGPSAAS